MSDSALDADQLGLASAATAAITASSLNPMSAGLMSPAMADLLPGLAGLGMTQDPAAGVGRPVIQAGSGAGSANAVGGGLSTQSSVSTDHGLVGRTLSRNSYSPMSDSGISVDAASTGSMAAVAAAGSQAFNAALSKFIPPLSASSHGESIITQCCMFATKLCPRLNIYHLLWYLTVVLFICQCSGCRHRVSRVFLCPSRTNIVSS